MKKQLAKLLLFFVILFSAALTASAQIYVKIRPVVPVVIRPAPPSRAHVWIGEEWNNEGGNYRYSGGYWSTPPHPGERWRKGHWSHDRSRGHQWIPGGWKARRG